MTCIVGSVHNGVVMIGGDSAGVAGLDLTIRKDPKVFLVGEVAFGFTTSFRMGQLLQHSLKIPDMAQVPNEDLSRYMVTGFIDEIRTCLKDGGYTKVDNNREEGGDFLVGIKGRLFRVESDFQVGESALGYDAIGSGASYALGSLYQTNPVEDLSQRNRLYDALTSSMCFSAGVRAPFNFVETLRQGEE